MGRRRHNENIRQLLSEYEGRDNLDLASEMIQTTLNLIRDEASRGDLKVLNKALKELRYAFKMFSEYRNLRKVSIFGSARTPEGSPEYEQAVELSRKVASEGFMVITGAGPGIMEAAQEGAGRDRSFGVNIRLPFEQDANPIILGDSKLVTFKYFFTRKLQFLKETSAIVCFPGGFGTMDEAFESLTLMQTGKSNIMPMVLIDAPGGNYWKKWGDFVRAQLLHTGMISEEDLHLYLITDSVEEACREIAGFYHNYHSLRYVDDLSVIRLNYPLGPEDIAALNRDFSDILAVGEFTCRPAPFDQEFDEPELKELHRLAFQFNRRNFGRLRQLIDRLNNLGAGVEAKTG